ncbi:MAG: hypothetical protein KC609_26720 [Myxococcales bacterium]|nr:hypothetical protein [Myxococcales bacterium]
MSALVAGPPARAAANPTTGELRSISKAITGIVGLRWILWIGLATLFLGDGLWKPYSVGTTQDWRLQAHMTQSSHRSIARYGQFPAWDPYECGGIYGSGNLQNNGSSPTQLLAWIFGLMPGWKIAMLLMFILGLEGGFLYARWLGIDGLGAVLAACAFCFSGRFAQALIDGHPHFLGFLLFPWVVLSLEKGFRDWRWTVLGGLFMAWIFADGGAVSTPMTAMVLLFHTIYFSVCFAVSRDPGPRWFRPPVALAAMALVTALVSAVILLPALSSWAEAPRVWTRPQHFPLPRILGLLFIKPTLGGLIGVGTSYAGELTLGLFLAMLLFRDRLTPQLLVLFVVAVALSTGDHGLFGIYDWQKKLPLFRNLRHPFRYTLFAAFYLALGAGRGLALLEHHLLELVERWSGRAGIATAARGGGDGDASTEGARERAPRWRVALRYPAIVLGLMLVAGLGYLASAEVYRVNRKRVAKVFTVPTPRPFEQPFHQSVGSPHAANVWSAVNLGSLSCIQAQPFPISKELRGDRTSELFLSDPRAGTLRLVEWTPHRIRLDVALAYRTGLIANMNYHRGWRVDHGTVTNYKGLQGATLPKGRYRLTLTFSDPRVNLGMLISLLTLFGIAGFFGVGLCRRWSRRSGSESTLAAGAAIAQVGFESGAVGVPRREDQKEHDRPADEGVRHVGRGADEVQDQPADGDALREGPA